MCIEVSLETGIKDVETQWWIIERWRDAILKAWPESLNDIPLGDSIRRGLMEDLDRRKKAGVSFAKLASLLNGYIVEELQSYLDWKDRGEWPRAGWLDFEHPRYRWVAAMELLRWFGPQRRPRVTDTQREQTLLAALDELRNGRPAFDDLGVQPPISEGQVKARLRQWRKQTELK